MKLVPLCLAMLASTHASQDTLGRRHLHHQHRRAVSRSSTHTESDSSQSHSTQSHSTESTSTKSTSSKSHSSSSSKKPDSSSSTITSALPSLDSLPTLSLTSSSSSATSYTYQATVPTEIKNPYISKSALPTNSVFIIVAAVLGLLMLAVFLASFIMWMDSRRKAKKDKEVQYYNPFQYAQSEKGLFLHTDSSSYSAKSSSASSDFTTSQGRSYRDMSMGLATAGNRTSMTISPVFEMMQSSRSNLELPLFNEPYTHSHTQTSSPDLSYREERTSSSDLLKMSDSSQSRPGRKSRPPSQLLDDMLLGIEFGEEYPTTK